MLEPLTADDPRAVGRFTLDGRLGAGAMGRVYLGRDGDGTVAAIKVVRQDLADDPEFRARFRHEVAAVGRVLGNHTAALVDADTDAARPWLATEYLPGPTLRDVVRERGPLPAGEVLRIAGGVAEALVVIHAAGLVHRDLKPGNVLLTADGPRVIDFGIARATDVTSLTATGISIGTPAYMAPEHIGGAEAGPPADVFALGGLITLLATGRSPFGDGPASAVLYRITHTEPNLDGLPEPLRGLVAPCLDRDPARRPTPATLAETCARLLAPAPEPPTTRVVAAPRKGRRAGVLLAVLLLLAAVVAVPLLRDRTTAGTPVPAAGAPTDNDLPEPAIGCDGAKSVRSAGSELVAAAVTQVATAYARLCGGHSVAYEQVDQNVAVQGFESGTYPMVILDKEPTTDEREAAATACAGSRDLVLLPLVLSPVALPYRLPGVDRLVLDAPTVAKIFEGQLDNWQDSRIAALNPGVVLPDLQISVVPRLDPAAVTNFVQSYLVRAAPDDWGDRGAGDTFGSLGGFRQEGEAAVLATVASTNGAIGYASYAAVRAQGLPVVELATSTDPASASQPDATDVVAAVQFAEIGGSLTKLQDGIYGVTADGSATPYPLVGVHYLLGCQTYADPETAAAVRDFVKMAITQPVDPAATYVLPTGRLADQVADLADTISE